MKRFVKKKKNVKRCYDDIAKLCINIEVLQALGNLNKDLTASMQSSVAPWWLLLHLRHDDSCISESKHICPSRIMRTNGLLYYLSVSSLFLS